MPSEGVPIHTGNITVPFTEDMLMDAGVIPSPPRPERPPEPLLIRVLGMLRQRYWHARWRLAEIIAGQPLDDDPSSW